MKLDFSKLAGGGTLEAVPDQGAKTGQPPEIERRLEHKRDELDRAAEICAEYQKNIKAAEALQVDIIKGVKRGESPAKLFLEAVHIISLMTGNEAVYSQILADFKAIYGRGLRGPAPLAMELEEVEARAKKLEAAEAEEEDPDSRARIRNALAAHKAEARRLREALEA